MRFLGMYSGRSKMVERLLLHLPLVKPLGDDLPRRDKIVFKKVVQSRVRLLQLLDFRLLPNASLVVNHKLFHLC
jgi:hypothetical protein